MNESEQNYAVASMWLDILMKSSTADDVERYHQIANLTPVDINIIMMTGNTKDMLLREFLDVLKIPKSTFTSYIDRLDKKGYIERVINPRDKRSFGLKLTPNGEQLMKLYMAYQAEMGSKILKGLNKDEQHQLIYLLEKIIACVMPK